MSDKHMSKNKLTEKLIDEEEEVDTLGKLNDNERNSNSINPEDDVLNDTLHNKQPGVPEENKNYMSLADLPEGLPLDVFWDNQFLVPNSTRKALIAKWNSEQKRHVLSKNDLKLVEDAGFLDKWNNTVDVIAKDKKKQPMNNNPPIMYQGMWGVLRFVFLAILLYAELIM